MREILFRGKCLKSGEWVYGNLVTCVNGSEIWEVYDSKTYSNWREWGVDSETVGQYTGLKDKNGVEIYEGDIVKVHHKGETYTPYVSEVYFKPHCGAMVKSHPAHIKMGHDQFRHLSGYCDYGVGGNPEVCCEIIGNIHDNRELLEVK